MKKFELDKVWVGLVTGFVAPFLTFVGYYLYNFHHLSLLDFFTTLHKLYMESSLISLSLLSNLVVFYLFLQKEFYLGARGLIGATLLLGIVEVYFKYLL